MRVNDEEGKQAQSFGLTLSDSCGAMDFQPQLRTCTTMMCHSKQQELHQARDSDCLPAYRFMFVTVRIVKGNRQFFSYDC